MIENRLAQFLVLAFSALMCTVLYAQAYPIKPVRIVVPFSAGASTDALVRITGVKMSESWGV